MPLIAGRLQEQAPKDSVLLAGEAVREAASSRFKIIQKIIQKPCAEYAAAPGHRHAPAHGWNVQLRGCSLRGRLKPLEETFSRGEFLI